METKLKNKKVGIIGSGKFAEFHFKYWSNYKKIKVAGFYSFREINFRDLYKFNSLEELYSKCDIIDIVTNNIKNFEALIESFNYEKKIIFVEKPFCTNLKELRTIEKNIFNTNNTYHTSFFYKKIDSFNKFLLNSEENNIKNIYVRGNYKRDLFYYKKNKSWRLDKNQSGGGVLINQALHLFDLINEKYDIDISNCIINNKVSHNEIENFIDFTIQYNNIYINFKFSSNKNNSDTEYIILFKNFFSQIFITKNIYSNHILILFKYTYYFLFTKFFGLKSNNIHPLFSYYDDILDKKLNSSNTVFIKKITMMKKVFKIYKLHY